MTDPEQHANWMLEDIAYDRQQTYAEGRKEWAEKIGRPVFQMKTRNGIEEKPQ